jgi:hypothetical protein
VLYCLSAGYILGRVTGRGTARSYIAPRSIYATIDVETHISLTLKEGDSRSYNERGKMNQSLIWIE